MTDHTRTEKISGDYIYFFGHLSRVGNRYDSLATPLGTLESQTNILSYVVFVVFCMLNLSVVSIYVVIMHIFFVICLWHFHIMFNNVVSFMVRIVNGVW